MNNDGKLIEWNEEIGLLDWIEKFPCVVQWLENVAGKEWEMLIQTEKDKGVDDEVWRKHADEIWEILGSACPFCKFVPLGAGVIAVSCSCAGKDISVEERICIYGPVKETMIETWMPKK